MLPGQRWRFGRWLVAIACIAGTLEAQQGAATRPPRPIEQYVRQHIDAADGLPDGLIGAIAQTPDGYLWLGTRRGLVRFDGLNFTPFTPQEVPALGTGTINALYAEDAGPLWVSTATGLVRCDGSQCRHLAAEQIPEQSTWKVIRARNGQLFVSGAFGVRVGDGRTFRKLPGIDAYLYSILQDRAGRLWVAGRDYLATFDERGGTLRVAPFAKGRRYFDLALDGEGRVWAGDRRGMTWVDDRSGAIVERQFVPTGESFRQAEVWALATDGHGDIWLGTSTRGVLQWDGRRLSAPDVAGLPARDPVWSLARDSRGRMWAGTSDGLSRFTRSPFDVRVAGLGTRTTWSVRLDGSGTPWASTDDGEVWRWQGDRWLPAIPLQRDRPAVSLWPLRDGRMLMVDDEGRAFTGLSGTSRVTPFPSLGSGGLVYSVFEDVDRSLLVVTDGAIIRHEGGRSTDVTARFGLDRKSLPDVIWRDSRHRLLFGRPYLTIVDGSTIRRVAAREGLTDPQVTALYEEGEHLWIGTADSGLYVLRGNAVTHLTPRNARLRRHITGIAGDGEGALWITTRSGLLRVATREAERAIGDSTVPLAVRLFDRADGLPAMEFFGDYQSQLAMDSSGALWLPSYGGPIRFDPSAIRDDSIPPQVQIERTVVDGVMLPEGDTIRLPRHPIRVDITFAATNANIPQRVRASYRVIGLDSNWTDVGLRRFITFGPLRGGQYQVEIRAAGDGGPWSPVTGRVTIDVALAWYEQRWFYPLLIGTIILIVTVVVRRRVAGAERRALALEAVVAERTAELAQSRDFLEHRVAERTSQLASELEERSRLEQRLSAARKLESLGRLAGGVAHEINNALTSVLGFAQLAEHAAAGNEAVEDDLREVVRAGRRAADITHQLLAFAKRQHTELAPVRLDQVVRNLTRAIEQLVEPPMSVTVEIADDLPPIMADSSQIEQLLINLVKNARDASPADGRIEVQLSLQQWDEPRAVRDQLLPAGAYLRLTVTDQGTGIAPEIRDQLFDPFFTTKEHHAGTGLGLSVCQGIAARHHGAIDVESNAGGPTAFHCDLPVPATVPSLVVNTVESPFGAETILLVDDEAAVRKVAARVLTSYGYRVLDAGDGEEALAVFRNSADDIDAVVTDVIMPRMSGLELARQLRRLRPSVPIVFFSGFIGHDELALAELDELGPLLPKPFAPDALAQTLRTTLGATRPG